MVDELDEIVISKKQALDKSLLKDILLRYLRITDDCEVIFEKDYFKLTQNAQIVLYLLARKVMKLKQLIDVESASNTEISQKTGIKIGNLSKCLERLGSFVNKDENGYFVPNYNLIRIKELIETDGRTNKKSTK